MDSSLKAVSFLFLLLFWAGSAMASVVVVYPLPSEAVLSDGDSLALGSVMPGQTIHLIVSDSSLRPDGLKWTGAAVSSLPAGWQDLGFKREDKTLELDVGVPADTLPGVYVFSVEVRAPRESVDAERVSLKVIVRDNLISLSSPKLSARAEVGQPVLYSLLVSNESVASVSVNVRATLPATWVPAQPVVLKPNAVTEVLMPVNVRSPGRKSFGFFVDGVDGRKFAQVPVTLEALPSLKGKYEAFLSGYAFYPLSLLPFSFLNWLIGTGLSIQ
ncbi:MAG: hypothetical protein HY917_04190 [Candidatus Diapherotrites archaeon]|nr:hypothetical protein [Candidatus Diapherotrites archaeon]